MAVLEALWHFREQQARQRDLPVFKIMSDDNLLHLAQSKAHTLQELVESSQVGYGIIDRYGHDLLRVMAQGQQAPLPKRPQPREQLDETVQRRFDALHLWRKERAARRGVSSEIILSKNALWELAHKAPTTLDGLAALASLGAWRAHKYGDELLAVLASVDHPPAS
jgi:ribonuclease D